MWLCCVKMSENDDCDCIMWNFIEAGMWCV